MSGGRDDDEGVGRTFHTQAATLDLPPGALSPPPPTERVEGGLGRYEDLGLLGRGAMGEVRRVRDPDLNRQMAMKIIRHRLLLSPTSVARFVQEAQATAQLEHPGIVPVHELGTLPDGRMFFTMQEVRGQTLTSAIEQGHRDEASEWTRRRLLEVFRRLCDAVGYAHSRGVVHRDLKPDNVMVGSFGEVQVVDWGLVKVLGEAAVDWDRVVTERADAPEQATRVGTVTGTLAWMPPEQAAGEVHRLGPGADVFALGLILGHLLTSWPPQDLRVATLPSTVPEELAAVFARATRTHPEERYPHAGALGAEITAWLEGARRRERALNLVHRAEALGPEADALRDQVRVLRERAAELLDAVPRHAPVQGKLAGWALQDQAHEAEREASLKSTEAVQLLHAALSHDPDSPEAHAALARHYRREHHEAESRRDAMAAARAEVFLRAHDAGEHSAYLRGDGRVSLVTNPSGARVRALRFQREQRRLRAVPFADLGRTPLEEQALPMGSYLLEIEAPGHEVVRYPVHIERELHWDGVPPGAEAPLPIELPAAGELGEDEVYVPAGWYWSGGDPLAPKPLPRRRVWVDGFVIGRHPVTNEEYIAFLDDLVSQGRDDLALRHVPRERAETGPLIYGRHHDGRFFTQVDQDGFEWRPRLPVLMVDWSSARAYGAWLAERTGEPWSLTWAAQWEKAARGVDGRFYPWGDFLDPSWSCMRWSNADAPGPVVVDAYPTDVSTYGMRGAAGNAATWCLDPWTPDGQYPPGDRLGSDIRPPEQAPNRVVRGGSWSFDPGACRAANHLGQVPKAIGAAMSIRVARWVG